MKTYNTLLIAGTALVAASCSTRRTATSSETTQLSHQSSLSVMAIDSLERIVTMDVDSPEIVFTECNDPPGRVVTLRGRRARIASHTSATSRVQVHDTVNESSHTHVTQRKSASTPSLIPTLLAIIAALLLALVVKFK